MSHHHDDASAGGGRKVLSVNRRSDEGAAPAPAGDRPRRPLRGANANQEARSQYEARRQEAKQNWRDEGESRRSGPPRGERRDEGFQRRESGERGEFKPRGEFRGRHDEGFERRDSGERGEFKPRGEFRGRRDEGFQRRDSGERGEFKPRGEFRGRRDEGFERRPAREPRSAFAGDAQAEQQGPLTRGDRNEGLPQSFRARRGQGDRPAPARERSERGPREFSRGEFPSRRGDYDSRAPRREEGESSFKPRREPQIQIEHRPGGVRISKILTLRGVCSRREADDYIANGWVKVNGVVVSELGSRADADAVIELLPEAQRDQSRLVTILLHKPVGYVSGQPEPGYTPAIELIRPENQYRKGNEPELKPGMLRNLAPAGRLDIDSTGLLVLTQNGKIARQLIGEDSDVEKEYLVRVEGELTEEGMQLLHHGLELDGKPLRPAKVSWQNEDQLRFVLREGKKRQIRRMCELVGLKVVGLKRIRIGRISLSDLPVGQWRYLRE